MVKGRCEGVKKSYNAYLHMYLIPQLVFIDTRSAYTPSRGRILYSLIFALQREEIYSAGRKIVYFMNHTFLAGFFSRVGR